MPGRFEQARQRRAEEFLNPKRKIAIAGTEELLDAINRVVSPEIQRLPGSVGAVAQLGFELQAIADQSLGNGHADEALVALTEPTPAKKPTG